MYFGIDFGTTSSSAIGFDENGEFPFGDDEGYPIPSIVAIDKKTGEAITGRSAWEKKTSLKESCECIRSIKSILDKDVVKKIAGRTWTSVDIATEIFRVLKRKVKEYGFNLDNVTIAIPVGFSADKRKKIRMAAKKAGINVKSFVSEPTAAFFANYNELKSASNIAVFDWGGGTQDVTILNHVDGKVIELASAGNNNAGDVIDKKLARRIHAKIARKKGEDFRFEDMSYADQDSLIVACEEAKRILSYNDSTTITLPMYGKLRMCNEVLEYEWFSDIIREDVDRAMACFKKAVDESGIGIANIGKILMTGGSSNIRPLKEQMIATYGEDKVYYPEETMWSVSKGATKLNSLKGDYYSSQSVGIVLSDDSYYELLKKNTEVKGWSTSATFGIVDTTEEARFVFGGSKDIEHAVDRFKTLTVPAYSFLQEKINLKAEIDENMIFKVMAKSNMRPDRYMTVWEYPKLKCYYKIDESEM